MERTSTAAIRVDSHLTRLWQQQTTHTHAFPVILEGNHVNMSTVNHHSVRSVHTLTRSAVKVCQQGKGERWTRALTVSMCVCVFPPMGALMESHTLTLSPGSGVNFCSTCGPTVYPLTLPTLSGNNMILMTCLINNPSLFTGRRFISLVIFCLCDNGESLLLLTR